jgi:DNA-binding CsgD family transcriptional regulator
LDHLPNIAEAMLARAIGTCGRPDFEPALWEFLRRAVTADNMIVIAYRAGGAPVALWRHAAEPRTFAHIDSTYLAGAYLLDPVHELHLTGAPAGVYRLSDVAPDAFLRSRYYDEYLRQTTILDEVNFIARPGPGVTLALSLARDASSGATFRARDIETCERIAPIVVALTERHWSGLSDAGSEPPDVVARLARDLKVRSGIHLSPRQAEVALLVLRGHSSASIGLRLGVSPQTVKVFRRQLYERCGISSQAELFGLMLPILQGRD